MYNTHPHISTQYICQKRQRTYLIVSCRQEVVALVAASSQHRGGNERIVAMSLEPNRTGVWP